MLIENRLRIKWAGISSLRTRMTGHMQSQTSSLRFIPIIPSHLLAHVQNNKYGSCEISDSHGGEYEDERLVGYISE
jgi:hypothetical protein